MNKTIKIILCVIASILTALATVLIVIKSGERLVNTSLSVYSSFSKPAQAIKPEEKIYLSFSSPKSENFTTTEDKVIFKGSFKKDSFVFLNSEQILTDQQGNFTVEKPLQYGKNQFTFTAEEQTKIFNINRRYVIISSFTPNTPQTYSAGVQFPVSVVAKDGATVTATLNGTTINLTSNNSSNNGFSTYSGVFTMPSGHFKDLNLGKVAFTAYHAGFSETFYSATITCKREDIVVDYDPNATPQGGLYTDVGSGVVTEITAYQAETFDVNTNKDASKPYNNYLPKGTLDYSSANTVSITRDGDTYKLITLRCGKTVYKSMRDKPSQNVLEVSKQYVGLLPDHNEITFSSITNNGSHTILSLDVLWKAPFYFNLLPQSYNNDFSVTNITYNYVDITFCYATVFNGNITIPQNNPLFSNATVIKNANDYTLRLFLKKQGGFYGWDSYYDASGKLCFQFLNPAKISIDPYNAYDANLTGVKILIDVGHGGNDGGAVRSGVREADCNLTLANMLSAELRSIGASVYLTRTSDVLSTTENKLSMLRDVKPNYCIAIHHDSNKSSSLNGFGSYYFTPFSKKASELVLNHTFNTGIYNNKTFKLHYYYTARSRICPVVLTESGYMSNSFDFGNIIDYNTNVRKAQAMTKGIVEYFQSIQ